MVSFKLTLPPELLAAAKQIAAEQDRSTAAYIRQLIKADVEKHGETQLPLLGKTKGKK